MSTTDFGAFANRIDRLERELDEVRAIIGVSESPERALAEIEPLNRKVAELSQRCFCEPVRFKASSDFETKEVFFVVMAEHSGTAEEIAAASIKWHCLMADEMNDVSHFYRLSVRPV
jgi:hypothetical protein